MATAISAIASGTQLIRGWGIFIDPDDREKIPHLVVIDNGVMRIPTLTECEKAARILNEEGSSVIRLYCHNPECRECDKGWIERARKDAEKTVYFCDVCHKKMDR